MPLHHRLLADFWSNATLPPGSAFYNAAVDIDCITISHPPYRQCSEYGAELRVIKTKKKAGSDQMSLPAIQGKVLNL
jgi:hypothetical protein